MADVQVQPFVSYIAGGANYANISSSALVKTGEGHLIGIFVASTSSGTVKLWDQTSAATPVLVNTHTVTAGWNPMPFHFKTGLYVTIGGTADITVSFT